MRVVTLKPMEFDRFAKQHTYASPWQTSNFGEAAKCLGYQVSYLGIVEDTKLVGATLLLSEIAYLGQSNTYAPRGILIDYEDPKIIEPAFSCLKKYLVSKKVMSFTIDPPVILSVRNKNGTPKSNAESIDKKLDEITHGGNTLSPSAYAKDIINLLMKRTKFEYRGPNLFFEGILPRWYSVTSLPIDPRALLTSMDKRTRTKLRKAAKLGVEIYLDETKDLKTINDVLAKGSGKPLAFYKRLIENNPDCEVYVAKVNSETYVHSSKALYEGELDRNEVLNKILQDKTANNKNIQKTLNQKMESDKIINNYKDHLVRATNTLRYYPDGRPIAVCIVMKSKNGVTIFEEGYLKNYSSLNALYLLRWKLIEKYSNSNFKVFNFGGITGGFDRKRNPLYGVNQAKLAFKGNALEYIGEFGIMTNKAMYNLYQASVTNRTKFKI